MANPYRNTGKAGSPAHFIGTLPKIYKGIKKAYNAFSNTARQYFRGGKPDKPVSNFKPFHRDGKTYDGKMINEAFEARFKKNPADVPKIEHKTVHRGLFGTRFIGTDVTPSNVTNFNRADAVQKMRTSMNKSGQYPKSDPFRGSPGLR